MLVRVVVLVALLSGCTVIAPLVAGGGAALYNASLEPSETPPSLATRIAYARSISAARQDDCDAAADQAVIVSEHDNKTMELLLDDVRLDPCTEDARDAVTDARRPVSVGRYMGVGLLVGIVVDVLVLSWIVGRMGPMG